MLHHTNQTNIQIFAKMKFFSDFQICNFPGYNRSMAILDNVDNDKYPLFESESFSGGMEIAKDICSNGCNCTSEHDTEFIQDIIDFEQ
ncbi:hypothetical protein UFOVP694_70 [uncultured Caudovirales phage]|uniref:Uncharacterized protein n=1 Tax=uncultured Caudovirales phage TaxID=2100421 RepID=A0A6J5NKM6_9CAUD|nr:hypothetical protein UFOVP694_70 [uncultured Caudovirales phage]